MHSNGCTCLRTRSFVFLSTPQHKQDATQCQLSSSSWCRAVSTDLPDPLSCHPFLSSIVPNRYQGYILHRHRAVYIGSCGSSIWRGMSIMSSSLLLKQCPTYLVLLTLIVFVMGSRWPYICYFVGCFLLDLFSIADHILVQLPSSFFSIRLVRVHVVHLYSNIDTTATWKKLRFILPVRSDFHVNFSEV